MLSELSLNTILFDDLIRRLRVYIRLKIDSGEFTERSLARVLRVSQPHLHNMLKGARKMNLDFADLVLTKFRISVLDLMKSEEIWLLWDERNPDWMVQVAKRKPPARSGDRESDPRAPWRTGSQE